MKKWFLERNRKKLLAETEAYGLKVVDEEKFNKHIIQTTKRNIITMAILIILLIIVIYKWFI